VSTTKHLTLDFETYYDSEYSLSKMPNFEYITDPRFHIHGFAAKWEDEPAFWTGPEDIAPFLSSLRGKDITVVMHNAYFDAMICKHHFGYTPSRIVDTMGMANALVKPYTGNASLNSVAEFYKIGAKIQGALVNTKGHLELPKPVMDRLIKYAKHDVWLTWEIFKRMDQDFPEKEYEVLDAHVQMYLKDLVTINPRTISKVRKELEQARREKEAKLRTILRVPGFQLEDLRNKALLAQYITQLGGVVPTKISPTTGKSTFAFAKTDLDFLMLRARSEKLKDLVDGRILAASTSAYAKLERLELMYDRMKYAHPLLNYSRAKTGRATGGDKINFQALPKDPISFRNIFEAPEGHKLLIGDASQIEARVLAWIAEQNDVLEIFRAYDNDEGPDVYVAMADKIGTKDRNLGKAVVLGCGFGMQVKKFILTSQIKAEDPQSVDTDQLAKAWTGWRMANKNITAFWSDLQWAFESAYDRDDEVELGRLRIRPTEKHPGIAIQLPSGRDIIYSNVRREGDALLYQAQSRVWHGLLTENVVQAIARDVVFEQLLQDKELKQYLWLMVHDEGDYCVPDSDVDRLQGVLDGALRTPPVWADGLPTAGKTSVSQVLVKE